MVVERAKPGPRLAQLGGEGNMGSQRYKVYRLRVSRRQAIRGGAVTGMGGLAMWAAACSSSNNNNTSKAPSAAASVAAATSAPAAPRPAGSPAAAASPAAAQATPAAKVAEFGWTNNAPDLKATPKKGGTLRFSGHVQAPSLDPIKSASYESANIYTPVYSRLVRAPYGTEMSPYNPWGLGTIVGDLAESWTHPDPTTYTLKLRPNVKWQNVDPVKGRAFTSADVKYSFDLFLANPETAAQLPVTVTTPDAQTVTMKVTKPANYVLQALMDPRFVMVPHEIADADGDFSKRAVGTGPFILDTYTPNTTAHYKRNPDYFRADRPYLDAIQLDNFKDNATSKAAFISGQYEYAQYALLNATDDLKEILATRKDTVVLKLQSRWQSNVFHFGFPADKDPWKDQRVRTAISKGFDRSVYGKQAYGGDYNVLGAYAWINFFDSAPDLGDAYKFDPQASKQLLQAAGVPTPLNVPLDYFPYGGDADDQLQSIQQQLKNVNINLQLNKMDAVAFITKYYGLKADNPVIGFIPTPPRWAPLSMLVLWHSGSPKNYLRLNEPDLDAAIDKVSTVEDPNELKKAYQDVWLKLHQPVHFFTFPESPTNFMHSPKLHGFLPNQYNDAAGWGNSAIQDWWVDA